jgi:excisionase family DNA binding protein
MPAGAKAHRRTHTTLPVASRGRTPDAADIQPIRARVPQVEEVAARLKVKDKTVRDWIARGELEAYKIGKERRIRRDHFDDAIEARRVGAQPARTGGLWDPDAP